MPRACSLQIPMQARGSAAVAALTLASCAQAPPTLRLEQPLDVAAIPAAQLALSLDAAAPLMTVGNEPVFAGEVSLQALDALLSLKSGYVLCAGDLLTPAEAERWRARLLPTTLGRERVGHEARLQLPVAQAAPLTVVLRDERERLWLDESDIDTRRHGVDLRWAPTFADLQLQWDLAALPWDARSALDCPLRARIAVPLSEAAWGAEVGGRACRIAGVPERAQAAAAAQTWSAGLLWQADHRRGRLRVLAVDAGVSDRHVPDSAIEVGLDHEQRLGAWTARSGLAWRHVAAGSAEWSMDASLRRPVGDLAVSAQWQSGDRYWFVPEYAVPTENLTLSLDLSDWVLRRWPVDLPSLQVSYHWRSAAGDWRDESLQWRLWMPW
jgi:hypothetical protein